MAKTLIEEALDDAKQVRQTALTNAKLALEEAFEPRIKSMIARSLQAEAADEDDMEELEEKEDFTIKDPTNADTAQINTESADEDDEDLDLEAVIAELESEMDDEMDEGDESHEEEDHTEDEEEDSEEEMEEASDEMEDSEEEMKEASDEMDDDDIDLEELLGLTEEDEEEDSEEMEEGSDEMEDSEEMEEGSDEDEEIDLEELLGLSESDDEDDEELEENLATENKRLASQLKEHREAIEILRKELNEVNLLNAKLLYTTKLFKKYSLDNSQKMKVVESFDRTKTVREAKLIYSTLAESFGSVKVKTKAKRRVNNSLTEGLASSVVKSTKPKTNIINESNDVANRFKKLISYNKNK